MALLRAWEPIEFYRMKHLFTHQSHIPSVKFLNHTPLNVSHVNFESKGKRSQYRLHACQRVEKGFRFK